ncbi:ead/Ea22-like family protein [Klebsiella variicola]|uniref:ead/Ea22-like family protein n=1 Tax=Klebsiella variicola TaxID=244366 RepID=UPI00295E4700|nr:ead/Ea22-like family protein [Klebsiella variicola]MDW0348106.1 ead/Ea22-like family protein [Klebsiella variicola]
MTDITELAQSLKAAAEKATQGNWRAFQYHDGRCGIGGGHNAEIMVCEHISKERPHDAMFIALANPANVLALVEALEKAQQVDEELCRLLPPGAEYMDPPDGGDVTPLEGVRRMVADYRQRIAELESRTVKLPDLRQIVSGDRYVWSDGVYNYSQDVKVALAAAGIKVEAE